jgi:hypothetical protein
MSIRWEDKTSKKHLRRRFSSLVRRILLGMSLALLRLASTYRDRRRRKDPAVRALGGFMKDISTILLAGAFVLFTLIVLLSAASTPDRTSSTLDNDQQKVSDLGLRFAFKR